MKDIQNFQVTLSRMSELLRLGGRVDWAIALKEIQIEIENEKDLKDFAGRILSMYGGMGSLNDLILFRNGVPLVNENNELDNLRAQLYELCHS